MESELHQLVTLPTFFGAYNDPSTFSAEDKCLPLPVPNLNQTLELYLDSAEVHLSISEYRNTVTLVENFLKADAPRLQAKLQERAETKKNWLEEWWEKLAYLKDRTPLLPGGNMSGTCPFYCHYWPPEEGSQLFRAAVVIHLATYFRQKVRQGRVPIDKRADGTLLSMVQYRRLFNSSREPGIDKDRLLSFFQTCAECSLDENSYVIVISNGRLFRLEVFDNQKCEVKPIPELRMQLQRIEAMSQDSEGPGIPRLTSMDRSSWAQARNYLRTLDPNNVDYLDTIDRAAFCVTLDPTSPALNELLQVSMRAAEGMVWADKTYSVIVHQNGIVEVTSDHAHLDGIAMMTATYFLDVEIYKKEGYLELTEEAVEEPDQFPPPTELTFVVDDFIQDQIEVSRVAYLKAGQNIVAKLPRFRHWGRRAMKTFSVHPDTAVQLALQLAYYRLHGKPAPTYETATTRRFYHGRTETIRSCTPEAVGWCRAMLQPGCPQHEKMRLFSLAHMKHNELRRACEDGRGCDRHMMGLSCIASEEGLPTPTIFNDPAWEKSGGNGNFSLSTSTLGYASVIGCVRAMTKDGYGCFYRMGVELIEMAVTTYRDSGETNCEKMVKAIDESMKDILVLLQASGINKKSKL